MSDRDIKYDDVHAIELAPGVHHLGVKDNDNSWANIPYLVVEGGEAALIDPGSMKSDFYACVMRKIHGVLKDPRQIKYIIVQHQDPDLCAAIAMFEKISSPDVKILTSVESRILVDHYGFDSPLETVTDGGSILLGGERELSFHMTPYAHFVGSMVTYDARTKTVFSSDAFGGFSASDSLYATDDYPEFLTAFLGQYLGSKRSLEYALKRLTQLATSAGIDRICPQHGQVIPKEAIPVYMEAAANLHVGGEIDMLAKKHGIELDWEEINKSSKAQ